MLERYFVRPCTVDRIRALWLGPAIERYVEWLAERHAAPDTVQRAVQMLVHFNDFARAHGASTWEELPQHLEPFVDQRMQRRNASCEGEKERRAVRSDERVPVEQLLRLLLPDFVGTQRRLSAPFQASVPGFFYYLREERGLRPRTIHRYEHHLRAFEAYLQRVDAEDLCKLTPALLSTFLIESAQRLGSGGVADRGSTLRAFLRYLHRQDIIATDLSRSVPRGRSYPQASIPRAIPWSSLQRVLDAVDRRAPLGKRDYAILLLLISYGLRAREISALQLEDIDWRQEQLHVSGRKGGHSTIYPLSATVGEAIIEYLRFARPQIEERRLFLLSRSPFTPLEPDALSRRAAVYLRAAGIEVPRPGSHTFRHSCVQHLVEADVPFKVIGDYVGHRTPAATQVYGKVALHKLRELALGEAEEVL
jgi:integrase/recombinase XerD